MPRNRGFSRAGLIVVVIMLLIIILLVNAWVKKIRKIGERYICGANLMAIGTAMNVYANDYKNRFPQLPGIGPWSKELGFDYDLAKPDFLPDGAQYNVGRTITASWYLLVREADIDPNTFVCPLQDQIIAFDGSNPNKRDIAELWDFGFNPHQHVSYVMHNPYGKFPGDERRSAAFAIAADMSPWFQNGDIDRIPQNTRWQQINDPSNPWLNQLYNSTSHGGEGQFVLFADGHWSFETRPDVGIKNDNIYTYWLNNESTDPNELYRRIGQPPLRHSSENDAKNADDSFLAI